MVLRIPLRIPRLNLIVFMATRLTHTSEIHGIRINLSWNSTAFNSNLQFFVLTTVIFLKSMKDAIFFTY